MQQSHLEGGAGNDTLDGGAGNDTLHAGLGNNTYLFGKGDGQDVVQYYADSAAGKLNTLQFKEGVLASEISLKQVQDTQTGNVTALEVSITGTSDKIAFNGFFTNNDPANANNPVQQFRFADGSTWDLAAIKAKLFAGTSGADAITGTPGSDTINGAGGNDALYGLAGDDLLDGGVGNDYLEGGAGNDTLHAGLGNNTYLFGKGDGQDVVQYYADSAAGKLNTLQFKEGVLASEISLKQVQDTQTGNVTALEVSITGTSDKIAFNGFFTNNDPANANNPVQQFKFADGSIWSLAQIAAKLSEGTGGTLAISGTPGNDNLEGGAGNDTLDGGAGNDTLNGGYGNNTYLFGKGDGQDLLQYVYDTAAGKLNTLRLKQGVLTSEVTLKQVNDSTFGGLGALEVSITGTTDKITINGFFRTNDPSSPFNPLQQLSFADGTTWDMNTILAKVFAGTSAADVINGTINSDTINGGLGDDTLSGMAGNDTLLGGEGNDNLYGLAGDDVLNGGAGNDFLEGGTSNDIYVFGLGAGSDAISDYDTASGNTDVLAIGAGVATDQLWFRRVGSNLEISIIGTDDKSIVSNWYSGIGYHIEQFKTTDGKVLTDTRVQALVDAMAAFSPPSAGQTTLPSAYQGTLTPVIAANWQ